MENQDQTNETPQVDELTLLKQRATMLGVSYGNNISVATLKAKIEAKMAGDEENAASTQGTNALGDDTEEKQETQHEFRQRLMNEQMKLVRLRITNLDPKKKDLPGEIITVANKFIGTVRKFVPYGEQTENGYHVPWCIYQVLDSRKFLNVRTRKGKNGIPVIEQNWAREFALEVLDPLTEAELAELAKAQIAAGSTNSLAD